MSSVIKVDAIKLANGNTPSTSDLGLKSLDVYFWENNNTQGGSGTSLITSGWAVSNEPNAANFGAGMSESSGVFTFPNTGIWRLDYHAFFVHNGNDGHVAVVSQISTDGGANFSDGPAATGGNRTSSDPQISAMAFYLMDVNSTSNVKLRFQIQSANPATASKIYVGFTKLGENS
tara:strand:- start:2281 stop:2805 length:525 start_codon:yes stop_codon:yes gene_type:complete